MFLNRVRVESCFANCVNGRLEIAGRNRAARRAYTAERLLIAGNSIDKLAVEPSRRRLSRGINFLPVWPMELP